jgi:lipid II:glycine glycyltransferase (peptidoglycan interpeptide bridge formation enzyme)
MKSPCQNSSRPSIFHEYWWLEAVTAGRFSEVEVKQGDFPAGRLPFVVTQRKGLTLLGMPDFTHLLGPLVDSGDGKPQTRMLNRLTMVGALIDKLPRFDFFKQTIDPSVDGGLSLIDGLAFQTREFCATHQYTFQIDCRMDLKTIFAGMHGGVRRNIRRAEEQYTIETIDDPEKFIDFYEENLRKANRKSYMQLDRFPVLFSECRARNCGAILAAMQPGGVPLAMTFVVWDSETMYYLLTTHAPDGGDSGSVSLLIWSAMRRAHDLGLMFDLDGVTTTGTARFLSRFGGHVKTRLVITKGQPVYNVVQSLKTIVRGGSVLSTFT